MIFLFTILQQKNVSNLFTSKTKKEEKNAVKEIPGSDTRTLSLIWTKAGDDIEQQLPQHVVGRQDRHMQRLKQTRKERSQRDPWQKDLITDLTKSRWCQPTTTATTCGGQTRQAHAKIHTYAQTQKMWVTAKLTFSPLTCSSLRRCCWPHSQLQYQGKASTWLK